TGAAAAFAVAMTVALAPAPGAAAQKEQKSTQPTMHVTLVGCIQREADYRREHQAGPGSLGTGLGAGYILINATRVEGNTAPTAEPADCSAAATGEAYELAGKHENELKP